MTAVAIKKEASRENLGWPKCRASNDNYGVTTALPRKRRGCSPGPEPLLVALPSQAALLAGRRELRADRAKGRLQLRTESIYNGDDGDRNSHSN
jgi:hypothetical protein